MLTRQQAHRSSSPKSGSKPKRGLNGYLCFYHKMLADNKGKGYKVADVASDAGRIWNALGDDVKAVWKQQAAAANAKANGKANVKAEKPSAADNAKANGKDDKPVQQLN